MRPKEDIQNILQAALHVFGQYGYRKATMEDVARSVGMTKGNLYIYVKNKRDLYEKTVAQALRQWQGRVLEAILLESEVEKQFLTMCFKAVEYLSHDDDLRRVLARDPGIFPMFSDNDPYAEINGNSVDIIKDILRRGISRGCFRPVNVDRSAEVLFSIYKMLIIRTYVRTEAPSMQHLYADTIELLTKGLFLDNTPPTGA